MKKVILAIAAAALAACLSMPAAAETFTTSDGVFSIELPSENWKEMEDPSTWVTLSDGGNIVTIDHFSNGEKLPDMTVADDHYVNVYQAVFSTQNEVFIITGSVVNAEKIPEVANMILTAKVLKYDTKLAIRKEDTPTVSEFTLVPVDKTMYVNADGLNVRSGCSTDSDILGSFASGAAVRVTAVVQRNGADYGWYQVAYGNGTGYVSSSFLTDTQPAQQPDSGSSDTPYSGSVKTVYEEDGTAVTLYEAMDGYWYDKSNTKYVRLSDSEFQVYEGMKRVSTYPPSSTPSSESGSQGDNPGGIMTVYDESGSSFTLYEGADGFWRDREGTAYTMVSDSEFQVYEGTKRVFTYDISQVTNDYTPEDYDDDTYDDVDYDDDADDYDEGSGDTGVVTAYDEAGTAVTLYESTDGYWYDSEGTAYVKHSDSDFQVLEGNKHLSAY